MREYVSVFQSLLFKITCLSITRVRVNNGHPVSQWSESHWHNFGFKPWTPSPPTLFVRPKPVRFLALWNIKAEDEELSISDGDWGIYDCKKSDGRAWHWKACNRLLNMRENTPFTDIKRLSESGSHGKGEGQATFYTRYILRSLLSWYWRRRRDC
jgi:hypothetical protein